MEGWIVLAALIYIAVVGLLLARGMDRFLNSREFHPYWNPEDERINGLGGHDGPPYTG